MHFLLINPRLSYSFFKSLIKLIYIHIICMYFPFGIGAIPCRMEKLECRTFSTQAKSIGTVATIIGALVATLYLGPPILSRPLHSALTHQSTNWVLGGSILGIDCLVASLFIIAQVQNRSNFEKKKNQGSLFTRLYLYRCNKESNVFSMIENFRHLFLKDIQWS